MKIVTPADNGPRAHQPGHGISLHDNQRRHNFITRRVAYAREAGIIEAALPENSKNKVANAARALVQSYQLGKVSRQQIEEEQRADETRLKGWEVVKPMPGTIHAEEIPKIKYRMAVRARALEEIASLDLAVMISPTGRVQHGRPKTPTATPWRAGTGHGTGGAKRGKPIGLREYNHCHEPAGSGSGGQFGSGGDCGGGGSEGLRDRVKKIDPEKRLAYANDRVNRVMDYHDATDRPAKISNPSRGPIHLKSENQGAVNRALDAANNPIKDEGTSQNPNVWKNAARDEEPTFGGKPDPGGVRNAEFEKKRAEWRADFKRLEDKYGTDSGRGPTDEYKGIPIYTLGTYTTPYYYISRRHAPYSFRNKVGEVNHYRSIAKIRRIIDGIKKATG